ncbi:MAG: polyprenyl synthetase family protein [Hydrotalea flava]|uniref:polyprenyl synthetase family protein n=1 Tax=Hydrotalea TaxID=1004300 RepID=UPI000945D4A6|nr:MULTISPECIES: polyprenyl synthetase family protein [Hydrotalea]MBY0347951.1 polyprenyl synthetase family protein [Hydrotalea flava]NIM36161.1 polyprenyl synthetase family protein [Hydrotalea flava]NIM39011.1 polyprenyl synthetase family protein [Hydrotalea flava]NIN04200.1 polyprenyl synthetase family protein [Hydrotalea flava]NIN15873.1 polyprenyl synthetase family protein [Hydrotalea flava]
MKLALQVIKDELDEFEKHFKEAVQSRVPLLDRIMQYIVKRKGKQLRPMFVLLSAKLGAPVNKSTYRAASLVELLHTATLVHDDVVDESMERRGFFSINALWKNKVAVLVGDYLLSKGLLLSLSNHDFGVLQIMSEAVKQMSEGELLQMEKSRNLNINEAIYFNIIKGKTASLLASACAAGASTTFNNPEQIEQMRLFGEKVGMAFQIKDDLFDYGTYNIGKPTGNDIKEKKLTLPLIYTLNNIPIKERKALMYILKNENKNKVKVQQVIQEVMKHGGIQYTIEIMNQYRDEALKILHQFPESEVRSALEELVRFTTDRKY